MAESSSSSKSNQEDVKQVDINEDYKLIHETPANPKHLQQQSWLEHHSQEIPEALQGGSSFGFASGIRREYRLRSPHFFTTDIMDGFSWKTKSAALFMFCATVTSTVALGDVAFRETGGMMGITEYLLLQGVAGTLHSLFSACPLPILRPTGPITAFMIDLYGLAGRFEIEYYSLLSWVGFWVGSWLILIALFDLSKYIVLCTRFLHDIYAVFVCTIYISDGILGVLERFKNVEWAQAFFAFYLALFCVIFSLLFYYVDRSTILNMRWRHTLSDYAVPIAVVLCVLLSYSTKSHVDVERISMPRNFSPTYQLDGAERNWFQGFGSFEWTLICVSLVASIPIVALFYIDHLFSCILGQKPELGLTKGEYYHSSMLITGICNLILPMFGMPFVTASLPHSPQFTKALTDFDKSVSPWKVLRVHESRIAPTIVYVLCLFGLIFPFVLELCPAGVANGILTFVGLQGILPYTGNQFVDRCVLLFTAPSEFSQASTKATTPYHQLPWYRIHAYTAIQLLCLAACWGMRFTGPLSLAFPLVVVGFIPLRLYLLPKLFSQTELTALDAYGEMSSNEEDSCADDNSDSSHTVLVEASEVL